MLSNDILKGNQVYLRGCQVSDATERYVNGLNDPSINQYLETRYVIQTEDMVKDYIRHVIDSDNEYLFAIVTNEGDFHIGNMHLTINKHHKTCFHAYILWEKEYWGRGIAREAIRLITCWAFEHLDIDKMDGGYYSANVGSGKAVLSVGYQKEGLRRKHVLLDDGTRDDEILVGMLREEYDKLLKNTDK